MGGDRALARGDARAARVLLERAVRLLPEGARPVELELRLIETRFADGEILWAIDAVDEVAERAEQRGDEVGALRARLERIGYELRRGSESITA